MEKGLVCPGGGGSSRGDMESFEGEMEEEWCESLVVCEIVDVLRGKVAGKMVLVPEFVILNI